MPTWADAISKQQQNSWYFRMMGGGSVWDIALNFSPDFSTVKHIFHEVLHVVDQDPMLHLVGFPNATDYHESKQRAHAFNLSRPYINPLLGCVRAIHGLSFQIAKPPRIKRFL